MTMIISQKQMTIIFILMLLTQKIGGLFNSDSGALFSVDGPSTPLIQYTDPIADNPAIDNTNNILIPTEHTTFTFKASAKTPPITDYTHSFLNNNPTNAESDNADLTDCFNAISELEGIAAYMSGTPTMVVGSTINLADLSELEGIAVAMSATPTTATASTINLADMESLELQTADCVESPRSFNDLLENLLDMLPLDGMNRENEERVDAIDSFFMMNPMMNMEEEERGDICQKLSFMMQQPVNVSKSDTRNLSSCINLDHSYTKPVKLKPSQSSHPLLIAPNIQLDLNLIFSEADGLRYQSLNLEEASEFTESLIDQSDFDDQDELLSVYNGVEFTFENAAARDNSISDIPTLKRSACDPPRMPVKKRKDGLATTQMATLENAPSSTGFNQAVDIQNDKEAVSSSTTSTTSRELKRGGVNLESDGLSYHERRRRNNIASRRSRALKKEKFDKMEKMAAELEKSNSELRKKIEVLEEMTHKMTQALLAKMM